MDVADLHTESWSPFFGASAGVSGGLLGLVFVALTFKPELFGAAGDIGMHRLARQTFSDFLVILVVSLTLLVPPGTIRISTFLAPASALGIVAVLRGVIDVARASPGRCARGPILHRLLLSLLGNLSLLGAGMLLVAGAGRPVVFWQLVFAGIIVLTLSGSRSAWLLVTHGAG